MSETKISIGLPVYNGGNTIRKRLDSILSQTYSNFELIISDNCSTDSTQEFCLASTKNDKRVKYFRQKHKIDIFSNFHFVLNESKEKYFVWASADDIWEKDFLKENINFLEKRENFVGSISEVDSFGESNQREIGSNIHIKNFVKKFRWSKYCPQEAVGAYEKKVKTYLQVSSAQAIYGIFKTDMLKKSFINDSFLAVDLAIILNVLKYGDFHVIQKKLIKFQKGGTSSGGIIVSTRKLKHNIIGKIFPYYPFTKWCFKNLEKKIFFKNIFHFFKLNLAGELAVIYDIILSKK